MRSLLFAVVACLAAGCGDSTFDAQQASFADYLAWESYDNGPQTTSGGTSGEEWLYRNEKPSGDAYPVGAIVMEELRVSAEDPSTWQLFAMAKRGGNFNPGGAVDWEYFTLSIDENMQPEIVTRGINPVDPHAPPSSYGSAVGGVTCNRCHGIVGTFATDHILDSKFAP